MNYDDKECMKADERIKEMMDAQKIPEELNPEKITGMLNENGERKRREKISRRRRLIAASGAAAVIALASISALPRMMNDKSNAMKDEMPFGAEGEAGKLGSAVDGGSYEVSGILEDASESPTKTDKEAAESFAEYPGADMGKTDPVAPGQQGAVSEIPPEAGILTAGMWNDNKNFSFFLDLLKTNDAFKKAAASWGFNPAQRYSITAENNGTPVANAKAQLKSTDGTPLYSAVTDNNGTAYLFSGLTARQAPAAAFIDVEKDGKSVSVPISQGTADYTAELDAQSPQKALDLMLVFDTTGSMGDELTYIQREFDDILKTVKKNNGNMPMRVSVNFYRDKGDAYIVKPYAFTEDFSAALKALSEQNADGGGDYPEAVHTALENAVNEHEWRADSVKLLFLVLDAPPHENSEAISSLQKTVAKAAEQGIRIIPVAASGSEQDNEFLMRSFALATGGTYAFLTNDSGIGGSHAEPTIGEYTVAKLNTLIIEIINSYFN